MYDSANRLEHAKAFDVTAVGVAVSLGTGVYVLLPRVAREEAGPAVVLSFLVAAVASCLADAEKCRALRAIGAAETRRNP
ncbi:hypothetical protein MRX96_028607 [Rhipicephalus microplus]